MPKLNASTGESVMGLTTLISVDGVTPAALVGTQALGGHWFQEAGRVLVYQQEQPAGTFFLQTLDLDTSVLTTVSPIGTTAMSAGGNVWAAFSSGGVRTSIPGVGPFTVAGLCEVSTAGQIATVTNINTGGLTVYDNTGARIWATSTVVSGNFPQRLRSNLMSWRAGTDEWQIVNIATNTPIPWQRQTAVVFALCTVTLASGAIYVLELTEATPTTQNLWLRAVGANLAYLVAAGQFVFQPDVIERSPGVVRLAWSTTGAEGPTSLRVADVTLASGGLSTGTTASGSLVFTAQPSLSLQPVAVSPYAQGTGGTQLSMHADPWVDLKTGQLKTTWAEPWVRRVSAGLAAGTNLATNVTGVLDPAHGGTGVTTGLTVLIANNLVGIVPAETLANVQQVGYWSPITAGNRLNLADVIAQAGSWSPLMTGPDAATSALVLTAAGDTIAVFEQTTNGPWLPNLVVDSLHDVDVAYTPTPGEGIE